MYIKRLVAVAAMASIVVAACGSDDNSADTNSAPATAAAEASPADSAAADSTAPGSESSTAGSTASSEELHDLLFTEPEFPYPDTPVELGTPKVAVIALGRGPSGMEDWSSLTEQAMKEVGWSVPPVADGKFNPAVQATLVQQAVLDKVDAIILLSVSPSAIPEAIKSAQDAGIPIVCELCLPDPTEGVIYVGAMPETIGKLEGRLVAASIGKPDAKLVMVRSDELPVLVAQSDSVKTTLAELCPGCSLEEVQVQLADLGKPAIPALVNILQSHPEGELDAVLVHSNSLAESMLQIAQQQGRNDFKIYSIGGTKPWVDYVAEGTNLPITYADLKYPHAWQTYAVIDLAARAINGDELWDATTGVAGLPVTQENAGQFLDAEGNWTPEGMKEKFYALWGMS